MGLTTGPVDFDWLIGINQLEGTLLTDTFFTTERHSVPNWKRFPREGKTDRQIDNMLLNLAHMHK